MGISPIGNPKTRRVRGFTLLEILVVLVILTIFFGVFSIRTGGLLFEGDLRQASRGIMAQVRYFRARAASSGSDQFLVFNLDKNRLERKATDAEEGYEGVENRRKTILKLPRGVEFVDISVGGRGKFLEGGVAVRFSPNGLLERTLVHLRNRENETYTLEFNPLNGQATLHDGYIDQKEPS